MTHYKAEMLVKGKPEKLSRVKLGGIEYDAKDEIFDVPDSHAAARKDAETMGLVRGNSAQKPAGPVSETETDLVDDGPDDADEATGVRRNRRPRQ